MPHSAFTLLGAVYAVAMMIGCDIARRDGGAIQEGYLALHWVFIGVLLGRGI